MNNEISNFELKEEGYRDSLVCRVFPELDPGFRQIELRDWDRNVIIVEVPSKRVILLNMPRISPDTPNYIRNIFNQSVGVGLVLCKIINTNDGLVALDIPCKDNPYRVVVDSIQLAQKIQNV